MNLPDLSRCSCGRNHAVVLPRVEIFEGLTAQAGVLLRDTGFSGRCHVVWDENTKSAAQGLPQALEEAGFSLSETLFPDMQWATMGDVDRIREESRGADFLLAVGTGSLNDLAKYAAFLTERPYAVYATAPSMDGFLSVGAAIYSGGFKDSFPAAPPRLLLGDSRVLADAPVKLKAAGFADLLGKYTALADWKISHLVTGEYYCGAIVDLTREGVDRAVALCDSIPQRDPETAQALLEALSFAGLAMLLCSNSRPASGAEHHLSHFWEMLIIRDGEQPDLHGRKVGVASTMVADLYHSMEKRLITFHPAVFPREEILEVYGSIAPGILRENDPDPLAALSPETLEAHHEEILDIVRALPTGEELASLLARSGGAFLPTQVGVTETLCRQALRYARYTRRRLTLMRLMDMIN